MGVARKAADRKSGGRLRKGAAAALRSGAGAGLRGWWRKLLVAAGKAEASPFWRRKTLAEMTQEEWESLCDGCGRCCLHKLRYQDTRKLDFTNVGCQLLSTRTGRCRDYANRFAKVPDCVQLTSRNVPRLDWLPPTCAYRLVSEGKDLYWWHPLVSGDPETVFAAGVSVRGRIVSERRAGPLEHHIVSWPAEIPKTARRSARPRQE